MRQDFFKFEGLNNYNIARTVCKILIKVNKIVLDKFFVLLGIQVVPNCGSSVILPRNGQYAQVDLQIPNFCKSFSTWPILAGWQIGITALFLVYCTNVFLKS